MEDFRQTWKLLSVYLKMEFTEDAIDDLAVTIDSNRDGSIDIHEFMEAFRLTDKKSRLERGRSMFMGTGTALAALETAGGETTGNTTLETAGETTLETAGETAGETTVCGGGSGGEEKGGREGWRGEEQSKPLFR